MASQISRRPSPISLQILPAKIAKKRVDFSGADRIILLFETSRKAFEFLVYRHYPHFSKYVSFKQGGKTVSLLLKEKVENKYLEIVLDLLRTFYPNQIDPLLREYTQQLLQGRFPSFQPPSLPLEDLPRNFPHLSLASNPLNESASPPFRTLQLSNNLIRNLPSLSFGSL